MICYNFSGCGIFTVFFTVLLMLSPAATLHGFSSLRFHRHTSTFNKKHLAFRRFEGIFSSSSSSSSTSIRRRRNDVLSAAHEGGTSHGVVERKQILLSSGVTAEVAIIRATSPTMTAVRPPLVFIHGSFHSAWCWERHYLPYFTQKGFNVVCALSLRGTNGTWAGPGVTKVQIHEHVNDVVAFLHWLHDASNNSTSTALPPAVLIGHSFGGLTIMKYLERLLYNSSTTVSSTAEGFCPIPTLSGCCVACSVPPSGNGPMTLRYLRRNLVASYKLTVGFAFKKVLTNPVLCRELFFGDDDSISEEDVEEIQERFARDSTAMVDLMDLNKVLPSKMVNANNGGTVSFVRDLPPSLVIGALHDFVVDRQGVVETAQYFGVEPTWVDSAHDIMLGRNWINGADAIWKWLNEEVCR